MGGIHTRLLSSRVLFAIYLMSMCAYCEMLTWMAVWPLGEAAHQPILRGQDEAPVLFKVRILEHV